ncbi:MAG: DUF3127 domain-containing protein [Candidatus Cyclonatronum sp.]|uniref:DUF3127 domain-containing protein n=1 Tax=Cyclonatronum sp. TaxID=3024185 RepID=UPI0025BF2649|nr:DUF3127 domain-containing protein [Cyclonatronum sp.]MCC5933123.1 DUF3127 domain-containing protein [Balneolales bacterium]MCH8486682.1 DUF3127 domain-containing protein [Cyclonatronum sp.]
MSLEIKGTLQQILPVQSGQGRNGPWQKQDFVIQTPGQYPKKVCFTMWGEKANILQSFSAGQELNVAFDVESREYNGKWYTDCKAWKVEAAGSTPQSGMPASDDIPPLDDHDLPSMDDDGDLPF